LPKENGNNVEATFDTVERIVQLVAFDSVASTLLLVWTVDGALLTTLLWSSIATMSLYCAVLRCYKLFNQI